MRARALLSSVVLFSLPFVACGRSEMEDDLGLPGIGGAGFGGAPVIDGGGSGGTGNLGGAGGVAGAGGGIGGVAGAGAMGGIGGVAGAGAMGGVGGVAGAGAMGGVGGTTGGFGGVGATGGGGSGGTTGGTGGAGGATGGTGGVGAFGGSGGGVTDGGNFFDAFPFPDSGPIFNCVSCAEQNCKNQVNACYNDPACASGVVCAATSCGGFNLQCVLSCFQGKFQAAIKAFQAFACLAQNCGQSCIGVVTGGGGLPPPGGGGPAPGSGSSQTELPPVAGGFSGYVTPEMAASTGLPAGPIYVPSVEVFDALGR